jgi:chorismate mutase
MGSERDADTDGLLIRPGARQPLWPRWSLERLVELAEQRLTAADAVAAAKWVTGVSIWDPAREKVVLDAVAAECAARGLDPDESVAVIRDQIEDSKVVQYGLFSD